ELGHWTGFSPIGTGARGGMTVTYAQMTFERGTRVLDITWGGPAAGDVYLDATMRSFPFLPEGADRFVTYDPATAAIGRLRCAGGGPTAAAIEIDNGEGSVKASRLDAAAH